MIPVLILAGIDVALGCAALWYRAGRNIARGQRREWKYAAEELLDQYKRAVRDRDEWQDYAISANATVRELDDANRAAAARRSARAKHARQCQIAQARARKAETTAKLQQEAGR